MIEIHRALSKSTAAIRARHRPKLVENVGMVTPPRTMFSDPWVRRWSSLCEALAVLFASAEPMAIRADDLALGDFGQQLFPVLQQRPPRRKVE